MNKKIFVTRTSMPPYEEFIERIKPLWDTHWLTNMGKYHRELEEKLKEYLEVEQLSLMVNGHMSLELVIQAMNFPEGSEVITTPFTFISTTHAIIRNNLEPVFCDIKPTNFTIDEDKIERLITDRTVAIVPVHVYGNICNIDALDRIAKKHNLKIIYDAAHAFGEKYKDMGIGSFGDASIFSFHSTKVFNTIEGGAVTTNSKELYDKLYDLKNFGIRGEEIIAEIGANAKMTEFSAIMGLSNLEYVDNNIKIRKKKVERYISKISPITNVSCQKFDDIYTKYNYGYFPVLFENEKKRNNIYEQLKKNDIYARKYFYPLTADANCFENKYSEVDLCVARDISSRILVLPLYPELPDEIIDKIVYIIAECV